MNVDETRMSSTEDAEPDQDEVVGHEPDQEEAHHSRTRQEKSFVSDDPDQYEGHHPPIKQRHQQPLD